MCNQSYNVPIGHPRVYLDLFHKFLSTISRQRLVDYFQGIQLFVGSTACLKNMCIRPAAESSQHDDVL